MTSNTESLTRHRPAPLSRLLVFVLLTFVAYTATVEAVHRHGAVPTEGKSSQAAVGYSGGADSSARDSRSIGECLVCQLHQHLFNGLNSILPQVVTPLDESTRAQAAALPNISETGVPTRGRAPPLSS